MGIGERIAEERKRFGLSQSDFASLVGVSFSSQRRYEKESRAPDTEYLESLRRNGVDVEYVLKGRGKSHLSAYVGDSLLNLGHAVVMLYGIPPNELNAAVANANQAVANMPVGDDPEMALGFWDAAFFPEVARIIEKRIVGENNGIDSAILCDVLEGLDAELSKSGIALSSAKKAQVVAMLYRSFVAGGKIDLAMIKEAATLATS